MGWLSRILGGRTKVDAGMLDGSDRFQDLETKVSAFLKNIGDDFRETTSILNKKLKDRNNMGTVLGTMNADNEMAIKESGAEKYSGASDISTGARLAMNAVEVSNKAAAAANEITDAGALNIAERGTKSAITASSNLVKSVAQDNQTYMTDQAFEFNKKENKAKIARSFTSGVAQQYGNVLANNAAQNRSETGSNFYGAKMERGEDGALVPAYAENVLTGEQFSFGSDGKVDWTKPILSQPGTNNNDVEIIQTGTGTKKTGP